MLIMWVFNDFLRDFWHNFVILLNLNKDELRNTNQNGLKMWCGKEKNLKVIETENVIKAKEKLRWDWFAWELAI